MPLTPAVATAAALSVIEPTSNGIGADSFALIWYKGKLYGLNGSGRSPRLISGEKLLEKGLKAVPSDGWDPVMVPGTPSAWAEAVKKFGNLSLSEVLEPAAKYAEEGYPLAPNIGKQWVLGYKRFMKAGGPEKFEGWFETFAPDGKMLSDGDVFRCQAMADTLREIGATNAESFYRGELAKKIAAYSERPAAGCVLTTSRTTVLSSWSPSPPTIMAMMYTSCLRMDTASLY